eukprot:6176791-Pleurochrysis_carterae.AAC.4
MIRQSRKRRLLVFSLSARAEAAVKNICPTMFAQNRLPKKRLPKTVCPQTFAQKRLPNHVCPMLSERLPPVRQQIMGRNRGGPYSRGRSVSVRLSR